MMTSNWNGFKVYYDYDPPEREIIHPVEQARPGSPSSVEIISGELEDWDLFMDFLDEHKLIGKFESDLLKKVEESSDDY